MRTTGFGVRRAEAALSQWVKACPWPIDKKRQL